MSRRSIFWLLTLCTALAVMILMGRGQAWALRLQNQESETVQMLGVMRSRGL